MAAGKYSVLAENENISTAITILELTAPSTAPLELTRAWCDNVSSTTSAVARIRLLRKTATVTGTASPPSARALDASATSGVTVKWKATAEGTNGDILISAGFNVLNGWLYLPVPTELIIVPPSGMIALLFQGTVPNINWTFGFAWRELG